VLILQTQANTKMILMNVLSLHLEDCGELGYARTFVAKLLTPMPASINTFGVESPLTTEQLRVQQLFVRFFRKSESTTRGSLSLFKSNFLTNACVSTVRFGVHVGAGISSKTDRALAFGTRNRG